MRKILLLLCLTVIPLTCVISQNISNITITSEQLRTTNLIFAEHKLLTEKIPLLESKIYNLEQIDSVWRKIDSTKTQQILYCKQQINESNLSIEHLNSTITKQRRNNIYCYSAVGLVFILCLLMN